jgi:glycosyltransferase involved in cell wall biosynthesis
MRILHLTQDFAAGGAQRQLAYLAPMLVELGHEVAIGYLRGGPHFARLANTGVRLHACGSSGRESLYGRRIDNYDPRLFTRLRRLVRSLAPDVVHTWIGQMDILGGLVCTMARVPWVLREGLGGVADMSTAKNFLRSALGRRASAIAANSEFACRHWRDRIAHPRVTLVRNAVPLEEIALTARTSRSALGFDESHRVILYAGRLTSDKNLRNLIAALGRATTDPRARAVVCGDGPLHAEVSRMIACSGHANRFLRFTYRDDVWALMKAADVFVSVAHLEGCPNTVLEAMACGTPLVVSDIPQHREILSESSAVFVDRHAPDAIAAGIRAAWLHRPAALERAAAAQAWVQRLSLPVIARQFEDVYREMISSRERLARPVAEKYS